MRRRSVISNKSDRRGDDDGGQRGVRQVLAGDSGASSSSNAMASAPTTPVSCVFDPAASATGVRDELLLIGNPWKKPAARLAAPETDHFLIRVDGRAQSRRIGAREHARVGE